MNFQHFFVSTDDKHISKKMVEILTSILQRGRHYKVHVILSVQNPTRQDMKVSRANIGARMAFRCTEKRFSEIILDESGAEKLSGQGEMLFKSPMHDGSEWIQGAFITPKEIKETRFEIAIKWGQTLDRRRKFMLDIPKVCQKKTERLSIKSSTVRSNSEDKMLVEVILWVLGQDSVSCKKIQKIFNLGWDRANSFIDMMNELGLVGELYAKLPRKVLLQSFEEVPDELLDFLKRNGVSDEEIRFAISSRSDINISHEKA